MERFKMYCFIKKISMPTVAIALFMGNITLPTNNDFNPNNYGFRYASSGTYSGFSFGFKKAYADDCPADECIDVTGTPPDSPGGTINWGDYDSGQDMSNNGFYYGYANMGQYYEEYYKDLYAEEYKKAKEKRIKKCKSDADVAVSKCKVAYAGLTAGATFGCGVLSPIPVFGKKLAGACGTAVITTGAQAIEWCGMQGTKLKDTCK